MSTAAALIFNHNVGIAEESLGIQPDLGHREFTPVAFRVGKHKNQAGEALGILKLLLWATQKGMKRRMTLGELIPCFAEYWEDTSKGARPPSWSDHRNIYELWRLWHARPSTLVSDVFELHGRPIKLKQVITA